MSTPETYLAYLGYFVFTYFPPLLLTLWAFTIWQVLPKSWNKIKTTTPLINFVRTLTGLLTILYVYAIAIHMSGRMHPALIVALGLFYFGVVLWSLADYDLFAKLKNDQTGKFIRNIAGLLVLAAALATFILITGVPLSIQAAKQEGMLQRLQEIYMFFFNYAAPVLLAYWIIWTFNKLPKQPKFFKKSLIASNLLTCARLTVGLVTALTCVALMFKGGLTLLAWAVAILVLHASLFTMLQKDFFAFMAENAVTKFNRRFLALITVGLYAYYLV